MLIQSISQIQNNKIKNNNVISNDISRKTVNNMTLPSFADAKSLVNINFKAKQGIDINKRDRDGETELMHAIKRGREDVVRDFLANPDIDVNIRDNYGNTSLITATKYDDTDVVEALLEHPDIDVNAQNQWADSALMEAVSRNQQRIVKRLLKHPDIEVNAKDDEGKTALIVASLHGDDAIVEELLQHHDIDVNASDNKEWTSLFWACNNRYTKVVKQLVKHPDIDVNAQNYKGDTALIIAAIVGYPEMVRTILQHPDVDVKIENEEGKNALYYAKGEMAGMIKAYKRGVDKRNGLIQKQPQIQESKSAVNDIKPVDIPEDKEQAIREAVTGKIREEERIAARKEYEDKNSALDNLINDYQSILAEDISAERENLESGFRTLYKVKSDNLPDNMGFGEQMLCVVDILSKQKNKLSEVTADSPQNITLALQDKNGKISSDGLKFLERVIQVSDKKCSEKDLIGSINSVKNDKGLLDMEKVSFFIANLAWGQSKITDVIEKVENYTPKKIN